MQNYNKNQQQTKNLKYNVPYTTYLQKLIFLTKTKVLFRKNTKSPQYQFFFTEVLFVSYRSGFSFIQW